MRSVYALIPAALLAGTVLSASADAKPRKVELGAYAQRLYAQHKNVRTNVAHGKFVSFTPKLRPSLIVFGSVIDAAAGSSMIARVP